MIHRLTPTKLSRLWPHHRTNPEGTTRYRYKSHHLHIQQHNANWVLPSPMESLTNYLTAEAWKTGRRRNILQTYQFATHPFKTIREILLTRVHPFLQDNQILRDHQFGFRRKHATIEQVHRVVNVIHTAMETDQYCTVAFFDVRPSTKCGTKAYCANLKQSSRLVYTKFSNRISQIDTS